MHKSATTSIAGGMRKAPRKSLGDKLCWWSLIWEKYFGVLEVCHLKNQRELKKNPFLEEEKSLIGAIAESIARLVEREWAEIEIRKCRNKIEELIKQTQ